MKKNYYLITLLLTALLGMGQSLSAQTTLVDGLVKVSDDVNEYWYYIENGHNNEGKINDKDGRFCSLITGYANDYASTEGIRPNANRGSQKWKVVASEEESYYYIINKEGNYLEFNPIDPGQNRYWAKNSTPADLETCKVKVVPFSSVTPSNFVKFARKGAGTDIYIGSATPGSKSVVYESASGANTISPQEMTENPRSWRFVAEAEMEAFYPTIYPQNTVNKDIIEWYYIKSTDKAVANDANYLTLDPATKKFSIAAKAENPENQLFGFVSNGYSSNAYATKIIARGNDEALTLASSILTTGSSAQNWTMRHVFAPGNAGQMTQAVFRTARTASGSILTNELSKALPTFAITLDTYDNKYAWAFEKVPAAAATVTAGTDVTILTGAEGGTYEYGQTHTITYSVAEGYAPEVRINGELSTIGTLVEGVYTLEVSVTKATTIAITASKPNAKITITAGNGITVTSPVLDENNQFESLANLAISFTVAKGYSAPTLTATGATVASEPQLAEGVYTAQLTEVTNGATISITAPVEEFAMTVTKGNGVTWVTEPADKATYIDPYTVQFTVAEGYHRPMMTVGGKYVLLALEEGVYTYTLTNIYEAKTIVADAFKANVLPVSEDTFVDGRQVSNINLANNVELQVQHSTSAYTRRSYLSFSAVDFDTLGYNKASLKMVVRRLDKPTNATTTNIAAHTVSTDLLISGMSWSNNGESNGNTVKGSIISAKKPWTPKNTSVGQELLLDVTSHVFGSIKEGTTIRMQVAGLDDGDSYFAFYSREGAVVDKTIHEQPVLVFERLPEVSLSVNENITLLSPAAAGITIVESGTSFTVSFTVAEGNIPSIKVNGSDMSSELTQDNTTYSLTLAEVTEDVTIEISGDVASGLDTAASDKVTVYSANGTIRIATAQTQRITIYSVQGQVIKQLQVSGEESITLPKGLYLVKANETTVKVQL